MVYKRMMDDRMIMKPANYARRISLNGTCLKSENERIMIHTSSISKLCLCRSASLFINVVFLSKLAVQVSRNPFKPNRLNNLQNLFHPFSTNEPHVIKAILTPTKKKYEKEHRAKWSIDAIFLDQMPHIYSESRKLK
jgi:hypothetical protein